MYIALLCLSILAFPHVHSRAWAQCVTSPCNSKFRKNAHAAQPPLETTNKWVVAGLGWDCKVLPPPLRGCIKQAMPIHTYPLMSELLQDEFLNCVPTARCQQDCSDASLAMFTLIVTSPSLDRQFHRPLETVRRPAFFQAGAGGAYSILGNACWHGRAILA